MADGFVVVVDVAVETILDVDDTPLVQVDQYAAADVAMVVGRCSTIKQAEGHVKSMIRGGDASAQTAVVQETTLEEESETDHLLLYSYHCCSPWVIRMQVPRLH